MKPAEENARKLRELQEAVHRASANRNKGENARKAWELAAKQFHEQYRRLAFPDATGQLLVGLEEADADAIEIAIDFLEADPWFFRSGYIKEEVLKRLKRVPLSDVQSARIRSLIVQKLRGRYVREFKHYARLAPVVADEEFQDQIVSHWRSTKSRRAQLVLHVLRSRQASK